MGSARKIVDGIMWSTAVNIVNAAYGFIAVPVLISHFGKSEYGLIGLAMSVNVYMNLMDMGFSSTNVRFFSTWLAQKKYDKLASGFQTSLSFYGLIGLVNALILLVVAVFSDMIFNITTEQDIILKHLLYILAATAFCHWFTSCFDQLIRATENISWIQKRTLFTKVLMVIVLVMTILFNFSIELYFVFTCLAQLAIVPLSIGKIKKITPFVHFIPRWDGFLFKEMLPYSINIFSFGLFQFSFYNLRPVFLGIRGSIESVTDYRILGGIIGMVTMLSGAFTGILLPSTSKVVANNDGKAYDRVAYDGTKYISILACFCCFGMMVVGTEILTLYVGQSYLYLIPWFNLWLLCTLGTHIQAISSLILASDDIRAISYSSIVASLVGLAIAWVMIPYYNIGGVCIAYAAYNTIQLCFYYCYYWPRHMNINPSRIFKEAFAPFVFIGLVLVFLLSKLNLDINSWFVLLVKGLIFACLYLIGVYFFLTEQDIQFIRKLIRK